MSKHYYRTTRPIVPLNSARLPIETKVKENLMIQLRPFEGLDLEHVHRLRTQEAVMINTSKGVVDANMEESQQWTDRYLPPNDINTYNFMLWAKEDSKPWEHIGAIGCHLMSPVPHIGYMLRTEWWGRSIATKALQAFLADWWKLERKVLEVSTAEAEDEYGVHLMELEMDQGESEVVTNEIMPEILLAEIEENNIGSVRVISKCGFKYRGRKAIKEGGQDFVLLEYTLSRPQ